MTLAAVITALVRPSLRSAPGFAFSAAKMGEGKSLQADAVAYISTGRSPAMMSRTDDPDEMRKRVVSLLIGFAAHAGLPLVGLTTIAIEAQMPG